MAVGTLRHMGVPFIGSEAIASRAITPYALRSRFVALYPDVYIALDSDVTAVARPGGVAVVRAPRRRRGTIGRCVAWSEVGRRP